MSKKSSYTLYVLNDVAVIKKHLDTNPFQYSTCTKLHDAVAAANLKTIEKAFKEVYGYGIKSYHVKKRLEFSKDYLREGMSIKTVSSKCLYKSQSAYSTAFKKEFGITPSEWLKIICKETSEAMSNNSTS